MPSRTRVGIAVVAAAAAVVAVKSVSCGHSPAGAIIHPLVPQAQVPSEMAAGLPPREEAPSIEWLRLRDLGAHVETRYFDGRADERRTRTIDSIILHTTQSRRTGAASIIAGLQDGHHAHYLIGRDGTVYPLIKGAAYADHAGISLWHGQYDVSQNSIGIEIMALVGPSKGPSKGLAKELSRGIGDDCPITEREYASLKTLIGVLREEHSIPAENVLGHNQVAYMTIGALRMRGRKIDPGMSFRWSEAGLPDNYAEVDTDLLCGTLLWNPAAANRHLVTLGQRLAHKLRDDASGACGITGRWTLPLYKGEVAMKRSFADATPADATRGYPVAPYAAPYAGHAITHHAQTPASAATTMDHRSHRYHRYRQGYKR